jgi:hypothetical protein
MAGRQLFQDFESGGIVSGLACLLRLRKLELFKENESQLPRRADVKASPASPKIRS